MSNLPSTLRHISIFLIFMMVAWGCARVSPPVTVPPTSTASPVLPPTFTPTPCYGYNWAYGTVTPEFIERVQEAMEASGLEGSVHASTFGEDDGCGQYHAMAVDYDFTVQVQSLDSDTELASVAESIVQIAMQFVDESPAPNLGHLRLVFQSEGQRCQWGYDSGAWSSGPPLTTDGITCPAPTSAESKRLADALTTLSVDLACETSAVTANKLQAALECERLEGKDRYIVTVTFTLDKQGYEDACFHGYQAHEFSSTGDTPMTVTDSSGTYYERDRNFQWSAEGVFYELFERIKGGQEVTLPPDTREQVFAQAVEAGLIPGEGSDCP